MRRIFAFMFLVCVAAFSPVRPASALIKVSMPLSKTYEQSDCVLVGTINQLHIDNRVADLTIDSKAKGQMYCDRFRIQFSAPAELIHQVATSQPAVVFASTATGRSIAVIHVADRWLLADRVPNISPPVWRVNQIYNDLVQSFPGRTAALVRIVEQLRLGRDDLLNEVNVNLLTKAKPAGKLPVEKPTGMLAVDINEDCEDDLLVWANGQFRLFLRDGEGYRDASVAWGGPWEGASPCAAADDIDGDGKIDLLLGDQVFVNRGGKFQAIDRKKAVGAMLAVAVVDVNGDRKRDLTFLTDTGQLDIRCNLGGDKISTPLRQMWDGTKDLPVFAAIGDFGDDGRPWVIAVRETGVTRYPLDGKRQPEDFQRMTGINMKVYYERYRDGLKEPRCAVLDANGDGRPDLLIVTRTGAMLMVNRGFGAFLVDYDAASVFKTSHNADGRIELGPGWCMSAGASTDDDRSECLLLLDPAGRIHRVK